MPQVRIIAGERKGHRIDVPRGSAVRPTAERVREAVFSALGDVTGLTVLDLFAGTGAMGLESLSRGAATVTFVESARDVVAVLRGNIRALAYEDTAVVLPLDYRRALARLRVPADEAEESPAGAPGVSGSVRGPGFDLLFVDPPYRMLPDVLAVLAPTLPSLLAPDGLVVVEGPRGLQVDLGLGIVFERRYADTVITMSRGEKMLL
jgi:16S rRNA (guanine966-N2)-methyltransferase